MLFRIQYLYLYISEEKKSKNCSKREKGLHLEEGGLRVREGESVGGLVLTPAASLLRETSLVRDISVDLADISFAFKTKV